MWLLKNRNRNRSPANHAGRSLQVETLEDRCLMSNGGHSIQVLPPSQHLEKAHKSANRHADKPRELGSAAATFPRGGTADQRLPDLIAWVNETNGYLYDWFIDSDEPLMPGRRLLRLSNAVANIGAGPLEIRGTEGSPDDQTHEVFQRIYLKRNGFQDRLAGTFEFHPTHGHTHFEDFAQYNLRAVTEGDGVGETVATGDKVSFCLLDVEMYEGKVPGSSNSDKYGSCGDVQGISAGWADVYDSGLPDQWIDITDVPDGTYWLESIVDPSNRILESDETNNASRIMITLGPPPPDDYPNVIAQAIPLTLPANGIVTLQGRIDSENDVDMFSVVTVRKGRLRITQDARLGGLDSYLIVYNNLEQEVAQDDDGGGGLNSRLKIRVLPGQRYFIAAGVFGNEIGEYTLVVTSHRR